MIGGWRTKDESGQTVDASGVTVNGKKIDGLLGLRSVLLDDPQQFPRTVTEKLMAYGLGQKAGILRLAGSQKSCTGCGRAGLSLVRDRVGDCEESEFPDAEQAENKARN